MHATIPPAAFVGKTEFLSFRLGGIEYGLEFGKVKELRTLQSLERFTADGAIVSGVAVSRGVIMPLVDMREAAGQRSATQRGGTDVIILQLSGCVMGMVVDGITDVVGLYADQITDIPGADGDNRCDYLIGLGDAHGRRLVLVDIDKLMSIKRSKCAA